MEDIYIDATLDCNWSCSYCPYGEKEYDKHEVGDKKYIENINKSNIPKYTNVTITGGEPGIKSKEFFNNLFDFLRGNHNIININTNGMFIDKGYYDLFYDDIKKCYLHIVQEIDEDIGSNNLKYCEYDKVMPLIIVHNKNIDILETFLKKYSHIKFLILINSIFESYDLNKNEVKKLINISVANSNCYFYENIYLKLIKPLKKQNRNSKFYGL